MRLFALAVSLSGLLCGSLCAQDLSRDEMEAFLNRATVLSVDDVGEGVTKPWQVQLARRGVRKRAIFKSIDLRMDARARFGSEEAAEYADSYKHELAAYEMDKLLELGILPPAVERRINGRLGALRIWVEEVLPRYGHAQRPPQDTERIQNWIQMVWLFDYLICNVDRRTHNMLMAPGWTPILIDHSMAFATYYKWVRPIYRFPKEVIGRLEDLDYETLENALKPYLRKNQIEALQVRKDRILTMVAERLKEAPPEEVFFLLADLKQ